MTDHDTKAVTDNQRDKNKNRYISKGERQLAEVAVGLVGGTAGVIGSALFGSNHYYRTGVACIVLAVLSAVMLLYLHIRYVYLRKRTLIAWPLALSAIVAGLLILVAVVCALLPTKSAHETDAAHALEISNRATLLANELYAHPGRLTAGKPLEFVVMLANVGHGTAVNARTFIARGRARLPLPNSPTKGATDATMFEIEGTLNIGPNQKQPLHLQFDPQDDATVKDVEDGKLALILTLHVCYADDFRKRVLDTCWLYRAEGMRLCPGFKSYATGEDCIPHPSKGGDGDAPCVYDGGAPLSGAATE
jgi:hypothetical protein